MILDVMVSEAVADVFGCATPIAMTVLQNCTLPDKLVDVKPT